MPNILLFVKKSTKKGNDYTPVRYRIMDGRSTDVCYTSEISIKFDHWDEKRQYLKAKVAMKPTERLSIEKMILERKMQLTVAFENLVKNGIKPTAKALKFELESILHPNVCNKPISEKSFFDYWDETVSQKDVSIYRKKNYDVMRRTLQRFEAWKQLKNHSFKLSISDFSVDTTFEIERFMTDEVKISKEFPQLYIEEKREIEQRGRNTILYRIRMIQSVFNHFVKRGIIDKSPYASVCLASEVYGTPFYLTINERNKLYEYDLSARPELERQRDIFVFHCVVGCRVGDLYRLKRSNVIDGAIEYIAGKTRDGNPKTLCVPLNKIGLEILEKYKDLDGDKLLPFISEQKYNQAIKKSLEIAGIHRIVTIMDSKTRLDIQKPIYEVASSHMARRTLYGNVLKKTKSSEIAGSFTGHDPNSRAARRYYAIDIETKREVIQSLE